MARKIRVALVGLGFGAEFIPIYQRHPDAEVAAICQRSHDKLDAVGDQWGIPADRRHTDYAEVLARGDVDAVHINSPIGDHAPMSLAALEAGKHCACTVPMGTTLAELLAICRAERRSRKVYMMMETAVYAREFLFAKRMADAGEIGRIQFLRGSHQQDMSVGWPEYWWGFPPMHYATHAASPLFALAKAAPAEVTCVGSGRIREEYIPRYNSPFAVESALFRLRGSDVACEVTRSLYETVRQYRESFDVYGDKRAFEWEQLIGEHPALHLGGEEAKRVAVGDFAELLPEPIRAFTRAGVYGEDNQHLSFLQGSGHGGSHPHLVHEFVSAIRDGRRAWVDAVTAAGWTAAGIVAHQSAMLGGRTLTIPDFARLAAGRGDAVATPVPPPPSRAVAQAADVHLRGTFLGGNARGPRAQRPRPAPRQQPAKSPQQAKKRTAKPAPATRAPAKRTQAAAAAGGSAKARARRR